MSATEIYQLLKLPLLVEHYLEHKKEKNDMSIWEFLHIHYAQRIVYDKDYEKDMKLPFKSHNDCSDLLGSVSAAPPVPVYKIYFSPTFQQVPIFVGSYFYTEFPDSIWQPPRV